KRHLIKIRALSKLGTTTTDCSKLKELYGSMKFSYFSSEVEDDDGAMASSKMVKDNGVQRINAPDLERSNFALEGRNNIPEIRNYSNDRGR
ncbi:unnamed protein product, partial [Ilex paraguariensis]